ncbi:hypothetical protein CPE01_17450 [Cellulomonas persica]|uniref:Solute-binding protein family 5 domain-containing protein n=1 Tax=Cellulomonas persica TaxID=76861 RepID=A0A510UTM9_9CELL|nr:hypothetical protein CPE01_17450 [Cellulomonas persica]
MLAGCTGDPAPLPSRTGAVVIAVDVPFASLNAGTARGRAPGSVLVRSLVQDGFVSLDEAGRAVPDEAFGTVEKVADDPLTVRYTIAPTASWSDGVPVTAADLLLEWAARSGSLDDVVPELGEDGEVVNRDALDAGVAFAATSRALVHAQATPTVDDEGRVTVVYAEPVADWQLALDVNLPAHALARSALGVEDDAAAAAAVVAAVGAPADHRDDLVALSRAWRTAFDDDALAAGVADAVTTGPYALARVLPDERVELVRNEHYAGSRPARFDSLVVRSDLHPLDQVTALRDGEVDAVAPVATADVQEALAESGAQVVTGGDAVWQLVARAAAGGVLAAAGDEPSEQDLARAVDVRRALWGSVPRAQVVDEVVAPLWPQASVEEAVLATVGVGAGGAADTAQADVPGARALLEGAQVGTPVTVRLLANTVDPLRAQVVDLVTTHAREAGFEVVAATSDPATGLWSDPAGWDVALVPAVQDELPVASLVDRWGTDGATNVTAWSDAATDEALAALAAQVDPAALAEAEGVLATRLVEAGALTSLVRAPALTATRAEPLAGRPQLDAVPLLRLSRADLTDWWAWASEQPGR